MVPKDVYVRSPETLEGVTLRGKRKSAGVILRWGDYPGLSSGPKVIITPWLVGGRDIRESFEDAMLLPSSMEKGK